MPMPELDPRQYVKAVLSDPTHRLPMPDKGPKRFFSQDPADPETVDSFDPYYAALLADGSIRLACPVAVAAAKDVAAAKAATEETSADKGVGKPAGDADPSLPDGRPAA